MMISSRIYIIVAVSSIVLASVCGVDDKSADVFSKNLRIRKEPETVRYYFGSVHYTSPDGQPRGETSSLVKRTICPLKNQIVEAVLQPARVAGNPPSEFITTLTRINGTNRFAVSDNSGSVSGNITFSGIDWNWNQWTYDLLIGKDQKVAGNGILTDAYLRTQKSLYKGDKAYPGITEELGRVSLEEYQKRRKELLGKKTNEGD